MSTKLTSLVTAHYILLARSFVVILGCAAVWWGIVGLPAFWRESSAESIADRIIASDPFKVETLTKQISIIESTKKSAYCRPAALRSAAIIQLRMVEVFVSAKDGEPIDGHLKSLGKVIRSSLSCSPADPFLWLVLSWLESKQKGFRPDDSKYLRMSYQLGPNEGWISLKRCRLALLIFEQLPQDLAERAIAEFVALVNNGFYSETVDILIGAGSVAQDLLISHMTEVLNRQRQTFAQVLSAHGFRRGLLGVEHSSERPWR